VLRCPTVHQWPQCGGAILEESQLLSDDVYATWQPDAEGLILSLAFFPAGKLPCQQWVSHRSAEEILGFCTPAGCPSICRRNISIVRTCRCHFYFNCSPKSTQLFKR
jgi:hypothetical protein